MTPSLRDTLFLQSKCGIRPGSTPQFDFSKEYIIGSVEGILRRLNTDYLDVLLLHRPDALVEPEEVASNYGVSKVAIVIAWILRHPARMQPVTGTMNLSRLQDCVRGTEIRLNREDWYGIYLAAGNKLP